MRVLVIWAAAAFVVPLDAFSLSSSLNVMMPTTTTTTTTTYRRPPQQQKKRRLAGRRDDSEIGPPSEGEMAEARALLERIFEKSPGLPTKTTPMQQSIRLEAELVRRLGLAATTDELQRAVASLWRLWFKERGEDNIERLRAIDDLIGAGGDANLAEAERRARALADEFEDWAEPKNRLATVLYLRNELDEAVRLCERVIKMKPHHFGAISGIVACHVQRGDSASANYWMSYRLPADPVGRKQWAKDRLSEYEQTFLPLVPDDDGTLSVDDQTQPKGEKPGSPTDDL